jgi:Protein of unknown function (DUF3828)
MLVKWLARTVLWRRGMVAGVAFLLSMAAASAFAAGGSPAKAFLDSIYQHYVGSSAGTAKGVPLANAKAVRGYFTVGLASLIVEDRAAAAKRGEPLVLDGDPFVGRQDWDISNLAIEVKDAGGFKAVGTVTFMDGGKPAKIVLELLRSGNDWRIADIEWDSGSLRALYRRKAAHDSEAVAPR